MPKRTAFQLQQVPLTICLHRKDVSKIRAYAAEQSRSVSDIVQELLAPVLKERLGSFAPLGVCSVCLRVIGEYEASLHAGDQVMHLKCAQMDDPPTPG